MHLSRLILPTLFALLFCIGKNAIAQTQTDKVALALLPVFNQKPIVLNKPFQDSNGNALSIQTCRLYLSRFVFSKNGKTVWTENSSYHLLDLEQEKRLSFVTDIPTKMDFDQISFLLGIDSVTNVSGAFGGDLDPINGMYWAWQSGYINAKIEGSSSKSPEKNGAFQFHLGGYLAPFQSAQQVILPCKKSRLIQIKLDLSPFFDKIQWTEKHHVMSPCTEAIEYSKALSKCFIIDEK